MDYKTYLEKKAALEGGFGRVIVTHNGRTATTVEDLNFIAKAEGLDIEAEETKAAEDRVRAEAEAERVAREQAAKAKADAEANKQAEDAKKAEAAKKEAEKKEAEAKAKAEGEKAKP